MVNVADCPVLWRRLAIDFDLTVVYGLIPRLIAWLITTHCTARHRWQRRSTPHIKVFDRLIDCLQCRKLLVCFLCLLFCFACIFRSLARFVFFRSNFFPALQRGAAILHASTERIRYLMWFFMRPDWFSWISFDGAVSGLLLSIHVTASCHGCSGY